MACGHEIGHHLSCGDRIGQRRVHRLAKRGPRLPSPSDQLVSTARSRRAGARGASAYPDMCKGGTERTRTISAKGLGDFLHDVDDDRGKEIEEDSHPFALRPR